MIQICANRERRQMQREELPACKHHAQGLTAHTHIDPTTQRGLTTHSHKTHHTLTQDSPHTPKTHHTHTGYTTHTGLT